MLAPDSMIQLPSVAGMTDYVVILPEGEYSSGIYTIPDGREWDDFKMLVAVLGRNSTSMAAVWVPDEVFSSASWVKNISPDSDGTNLSRLSRFSSTQFSVTRAGAGTVRMLVGYLR
jgi:hypothetical protein